MGVSLREILQGRVKKGLMIIPEGWDFEALVRYYENIVPEHIWKRDFVEAKPTGFRMAKNTQIYKRLEKTLTKMERMRKKKLAEQRKALEKREQFYGMDPTLFGKGTVDLVKKNDLTMGMAAKALEQTKQATIARLYDVRRKAKAKNMLKPFDEAIDSALKMAKNQDESGVYFALNSIADAFERQLQGIASKRIGPRADGMPAKRPTIDDEDEDEKSPKAEED
jgi:hypothetical protein